MLTVSVVKSVAEIVVKVTSGDQLGAIKEAVELIETIYRATHPDKKGEALAAMSPLSALKPGR